MTRFLVAATLVLAITSPAMSQIRGPSDRCAGIQDDAARLRCYDGAALESSAPPAPDAAPPPEGLWAERITRDFRRETFTLTARQPNYIMHTYLSSPNQAPYEFTGQADRLQNSEIKFQLSFQSKLADNLFGTSSDLWFGHTQVSYWQLYNSDVSAPFRETNYAPEVYMATPTDFRLLGMTGRAVTWGIVHQSNGRAEPLSRSWNRVFAEVFLERGELAIAFKPWARIKEKAEDDDNPDITDYLGHYEFRMLYHRRGHIFSLMLRNVFDKEHRVNSELQWSFPIQRRLRGLVQWYNGYGENMIDYNHSNHRIGIGVLMTDWL